MALAPSPSPSLFKALPSLQQSARESDFAHASSLSLAPYPFAWSDASRVKLQVGGVVATTASAGFLEACLHFERRPIPLRFAVRYALSNVLPSAVWKTASAELVAAASGVSSSVLITSSSGPGSSSQARAKQLIVLKSVRSVRHVLGSYALAWSLWKVHSGGNGNGDGDEENLVDAEPEFFEKVVRLAPEGSALSSASRKKHGDHITTLPLSSGGASRKPHPSALAVDWEAQGLLTQKKTKASGGGESSGEPKLKLVEVELQDEDSLINARRVIKKAIYDLPDELLRSVAVLPGTASSQELSPSALNAFDICVNPLAVALRALANACEVQNARRVFVVSASANGAEHDVAGGAGERETSGDKQCGLSRGLLYQHGIQTTRLLADEALRTVAETENAGDGANNSENFVIIAAGSDAADAKALADKLIESGFVASESVYIVCEESVLNTARRGVVGSILPSILKQHTINNNSSNSNNAVDPSHVLSLVDISDALLQRVRSALREGHSAEAVQRAISSRI